VRVLVSGGGTAGHVYPALTVAALVAADEHDDVAFVGAPGSLEERLAGEANIRFVPVKASGWDRARPLSLVVGVLTSLGSLVRCLALLRRERTDVVVGFGGYVSLPLGLAAAVSGVPLVLHEQNSVPGLANRVLSRWATAVCVTYAESVAHLRHRKRAVVTGDPVRESVLSADADAGRRAFGVAADETLLLVFGGSRGARHLNSSIIDLYSNLSVVKGLRIVQIAGPTEVETVREALEAVAGETVPKWWTVTDYVEGMGDLMAAADLVVCRAGATTLAEVSVLGKPSVLVPYPFATDDHQTHNAVPFTNVGGAVVVRDADLDAPSFVETLLPLLQDRDRRQAMASAAARLGRPGAAGAVLEAVTEASGGSPWHHSVHEGKA
jgi:UDP-N-acetylglucosamine--N-acetylmuramyl-(pentapeptide) pyrophosphoryl-undecaprenol N-acetylglucosamine transferase